MFYYDIQTYQQRCGAWGYTVRDRDGRLLGDIGFATEEQARAAAHARLDGRES